MHSYIHSFETYCNSQRFLINLWLTYTFRPKIENSQIEKIRNLQLSNSNFWTLRSNPYRTCQNFPLCTHQAERGTQFLFGGWIRAHPRFASIEGNRFHPQKPPIDDVMF